MLSSSPLTFLTPTPVALVERRMRSMELLLAVPRRFSPRAAHSRLHRPLKSNLLDHLLHLLVYSLVASVIAVLLIS